jgi:uncharacterized protein
LQAAGGYSVTPQEEQLLNSLVERVNQTQLQEKDPDAEAMLNQSLGANPDALYILAQTVLVQNIALEQAKAQVAQLQQQVQQARQQPAHATSFLGSLLGHRDPEPPSQQAYVPPPPPPVYAQPQYQQPQFIPMQAGPPSFLRGAMQTAAGVAAGALAFEGVEAVLHGLGGFGHGGYGGFGMAPGMGMMGGALERPVDETVINNYYDQPGEHGGVEHGNIETGGGEHHFRESADQNSTQFSDASYNSTNDNQLSQDNVGMDDSGQDSNVGFDDTTAQDDGGSFDSSGDFGGDSGGGDFS